MGATRGPEEGHTALLLAPHGPAVAHRGRPGLGAAGGARRDRLLWLYDIVLVCRELDTTAWQQFGELCRAKQLSAVAVDSIDAAAACFPFEFPGTIRSALVEAGHKDRSRRLLKGGFINALISDLGALPGWQDKAGLVKEHLLPPAEYLLARYEKQSRLWLPLLYIRRLIGYFAP